MKLQRTFVLIYTTERRVQGNIAQKNMQDMLQLKILGHDENLSNLEMKRGKSLSRFLAKSIIIGEMIERKMQTDKIERRGNELLNSFDNFPINTNTVSTPIVKEKRKKKKQEESVVQTKQNVEIAQTEQKESTNEVAEEVINPVTPEPEEIKIPEPVKKVEESSNEDVEDKDSTEPILDEDTLAKAMNFMAEM